MRAYIHQNSFSFGELSSDLLRRDDLQTFKAAAKRLRNCIIHAEGKAVRWPGLRYRARLTHVLEEITPETLGAVTGSAIGTTNPFVVQTADLGEAVAVRFADLVDMALSAGTSSGEFRVQYSTDGTSWTDFGSAVDLTAKLRTRRRFAAAGAIAARYWRAIRIGATDLGAATCDLGAFRFWRETATLSQSRRFRFAASATRRYRCIASDRNIAIFRNGAEVAHIPIPHTSDQLTECGWTQQFDTGLLFHNDMAPWRVFWQGDDSAWDARTQTFENIPRADYGAGTGGVDCVQNVKLATGDAYDTDLYTITLEGETTTSFSFSPTAATFAANMQAALNGLDNVYGDIVCDASSTTFVTVTFTGRDGKKPWEEMIFNVVAAAGGAHGQPLWTITIATKGLLPGEAAISDTRGWPRCGAFFQGRLIMGGIKSMADGVIGSVSTEYFNLDDRTDRDDRGFLRRLMGDTSATILHIFAGAELLIFTDIGVFYQPAYPMTPSNIAFKGTTDVTLKPGAPVLRCDDSTIIVADSGKVSEIVYADSEQRYRGQCLSVLSQHLLNAPRDAGSRKPTAATDPNLYVVVNGDGTLACLSSLREQNLTGWTLRTTEGKFLATGDDLTGELWFVVERTFAGVTERFIESEDAGLLTDCAATFDFEAPAAAVTGLDHLEGATVWAIVDGSPEAAPNTVSGGSITLARAGSHVEVGLPFVPEVELLPAMLQLSTGSTIGKQLRIAALELDVDAMPFVEVSANGSAFFTVSFRRHGADLLDVPVANQNFSGLKSVQGLPGWSKDGAVVLRQSKPAAFAIRGVRREVVI